MAIPRQDPLGSPCRPGYVHHTPWAGHGSATLILAAIGNPDANELSIHWPKRGSKDCEFARHADFISTGFTISSIICIEDEAEVEGDDRTKLRMNHPTTCQTKAQTST